MTWEEPKTYRNPEGKLVAYRHYLVSQRKRKKQEAKDFIMKSRVKKKPKQKPKKRIRYKTIPLTYKTSLGYRDTKERGRHLVLAYNRKIVYRLDQEEILRLGVTAIIPQLTKIGLPHILAEEIVNLGLNNARSKDILRLAKKFDLKIFDSFMHTLFNAF